MRSEASWCSGSTNKTNKQPSFIDRLKHNSILIFLEYKNKKKSKDFNKKVCQIGRMETLYNKK
jgi:hypothetical protein